MIDGKALQRLSNPAQIRRDIERELDRTGGIFRLKPAWVGRPQIVQPGRRLKLADEYIRRDVVVNERWLASATYADNGVYNKICPPEHGLSYIVIEPHKILLRDAFEAAGDHLLGGKPWDVLPKFFDNWHRIPFHLHPCDTHVRPGLKGKPESYHFPIELNLNWNAFPATAAGIDPTWSDAQVCQYIEQYSRGNNHLTDLSNTINLTSGTGWYMPPCTLHAPGSLVTYELQVASDVTCIPESHVNDIVMPVDLVDRDLPVSIGQDGFERVAAYLLEMIRCPRSGNSHNFRREYFRPPVSVFDRPEGTQRYVIYRCGKASENDNPDLYSAKKTTVNPSHTLELRERAAFGAIILSGHGSICVPGKEPLPIESATIYHNRDEIGADEIFVAAAAGPIRIECRSAERLVAYQHFASDSNPDSVSLPIPEFVPFERGSAGEMKYV